MRKNYVKLAFILSAFLFSSCGGGKDTAISIAKKWCDLNEKAYKMEDGPAREAAIAERKKFEKETEEKYKGDKAFMDEIKKEAEKCEEESERK